MQMPMCSRCGKNVAVIFITKMDPTNSENTTQEGLCLKCARTLGIKPLDQMMEQMGLTDENLEMLSSEINSFEDLSSLMPAGPDMEDGDEGEDPDAPAGETGDENLPAEAAEDAPDAPFRLFPLGGGRKNEDAAARKEKKKRKYLTSYCDDPVSYTHLTLPTILLV